MTIRKVGVVGCGLMGSGIAQISAQAGFPTVVREVSKELLDKGLRSIHKFLKSGVEKGKLAQADMDKTLANLTGTTELRDLADCDLVVEAIVENIAAKRELFSSLDKLARPDAIFASNTSSLSITEISTFVTRSDRVIGLHFFNPVPLMKLGCGYPMGPLFLTDYVGLDTTYYIAQIMFEEFKEPRFGAPPLLKRMVLAGLNGRKSGRGFYDWSTNPPS